MKSLIVLLTLLILAGCESAEEQAMRRQAYLICVDLGGVPLASWYDSKVMAECRFK